MQPTPVFLPGEPQRQRSPVGCVYGIARSYPTEATWQHSALSLLLPLCGDPVVSSQQAALMLLPLNVCCPLIFLILLTEGSHLLLAFKFYGILVLCPVELITLQLYFSKAFFVYKY